MILSPRGFSANARRRAVAVFAMCAAILGVALVAVIGASSPPAAHAAARAAEYFPPPDSQGGWRTLHDAVSIRRLAGMDLPRLEQAYDFTQRCSQNGGL